MSYKEGSCVVGPISHISFIPDAMKSVVRAFEAYFRASGRPAFRPEDHSGFWRQVTLLLLRDFYVSINSVFL